MDTNGQKSLSDLNPNPIALWIMACFFAILYTLYRDINGTGLKTGMYYRAMGNAIYPIFYLSIITAIVHFSRMIRDRRDYIIIDSDYIYIGKYRKFLKTSIVKVSSYKRWYNLESLRFEFKDGQDFLIKSYDLSRGVKEIASDINGILGVNAPDLNDRR